MYCIKGSTEGKNDDTEKGNAIGKKMSKRWNERYKNWIKMISLSPTYQVKNVT